MTNISTTRTIFCLYPNPAVRQLCCMRFYLNSNTVSTIAIFIVLSKLNYHIFVYHHFRNYQITYLQQIPNSLVRAVIVVVMWPIATGGVVWSVYVSVCCSHLQALQKLLNRLRCGSGGGWLAAEGVTQSPMKRLIK